MALLGENICLRHRSSPIIIIYFLRTLKSGAIEPERMVWPTSCCKRNIYILNCYINDPLFTCFSVIFWSICPQSVSKSDPFLEQLRKCATGSLVFHTWCTNRCFYSVMVATLNTQKRLKEWSWFVNRQIFN